jgi:hypothetical protein
MQPALAEEPSSMEISAKYEAMGISYLPRISDSLSENGITDEQMNDVLVAVLKIVYQAKWEGEGFALDPRMEQYLQDDLALEDVQIEHIVRLSQRIVQGLIAGKKAASGEEKRKRIEGVYEAMGITDLSWIEDSLLEHGISGGQVDAVLGGMLRIVKQMDQDGEGYVLSPRLQMYFEEHLGLDSVQIQHTEALSWRLLKSIN